jgi:hypothetical protein
MGIREWMKRHQERRERVELARIAAEDHESERDDRTLERVWDRLDRHEAALADCYERERAHVEQRARDRVEAEHQRREDSQRCREEIADAVRNVRAELGADVGTIATHTRKLVPEADRTGRHALAQIARRSSPSIPRKPGASE